MFHFNSPRTKCNNQIAILSAGLLNSQIDYDLVMEYLKQQQNYNLVDFLSNYRSQQEKLRGYYERYQQSTLMKKEAYVDYSLRGLSEESLMCLYKLLQLPYAERIELAPYLKYPKQQRMELASQYPEYAEILTCSLYLREKLHAIMSTKDDAFACEKAHHIFAYLGPIMPFDREKYQILLEKQMKQYCLFKEMQANYQLKMCALKFEVLKYLMIIITSSDRMPHILQAIEAQINAVKTKQRYEAELSEDEYGYDQFIDIDDGDEIMLLEIGKVRCNSPTSIVSSLSSRSVFKMDMKIDEEAYMPNAFSIPF